MAGETVPHFPWTFCFHEIRLCLPRHFSRTSPKLTPPADSSLLGKPAPGILMQTCCQDVALSSSVCVVVLNPQEGLFLFLYICMYTHTEIYGAVVHISYNYPFKAYSSVVFSVFTELCISHHT